MTVSNQLFVSVNWISMARYLGSQLTVHWAVGSTDARQPVDQLRMRADAAAHKPHSPPLLSNNKLSNRKA
jgi:hypothetical protein